MIRYLLMTGLGWLFFLFPLVFGATPSQAPDTPTISPDSIRVEQTTSGERDSRWVGTSYYYFFEGSTLTINTVSVTSGWYPPHTYYGPYPGEAITITPSDLPAGATMPPVSLPPSSDSASTTFTWTPTLCQSIPLVGGPITYHNYRFMVCFNHSGNPYPGCADTWWISIIVRNLNRFPFFQPPALKAPGQINSFADTILFPGSLQIYPTASDSDCIQCGDDTLYMSYTADPPSSNIVFSDQGLGVSSFLWTPTSADSGLHTVTFTATDAHDTSATQVWNILVRVNHAPTITSTVPGELQLRAGQSYHLNLTASDYDLQLFGDDTLEMSYSTTPSAISGSLIDNGGGSATFDWTPVAIERGDHTITFKVIDSFGLTDTKQMLAQVYVCGDANSDATVDNLRCRALDRLHLFRWCGSSTIACW